MNFLLLCTLFLGGDNVVVVLDTSGSMSNYMSGSYEERLDVVKEVLYTTLSKLPPDSNVGILTFNGWAYPLGPINNAKLKKSIYDCYASGGTPLGEYMKVGADALLNFRSKNPYGRFKLVIATDGAAGDIGLLNKYLADLLTRGITINVIGVDLDSEHSLATMVHTYQNANDKNSLAQAVANVFAETTSNDQDDYSEIASLPNELVSSSINALGEVSNAPLGEKPQMVYNPTSGVMEEVKEEGWTTTGIISTILIVIIGLIVLLLILFAFANAADY